MYSNYHVQVTPRQACLAGPKCHVEVSYCLGVKHIPYEYIGGACADDVDADVIGMEKTLYYKFITALSGFGIITSCRAEQ